MLLANQDTELRGGDSHSNHDLAHALVLTTNLKLTKLAQAASPRGLPDGVAPALHPPPCAGPLRGDPDALRPNCSITII